MGKAGMEVGAMGWLGTGVLWLAMREVSLYLSFLEVELLRVEE